MKKVMDFSYVFQFITSEKQRHIYLPFLRVFAMRVFIHGYIQTMMMDYDASFFIFPF